MTYQTPGEQEAAIAAAFEARLDEVCAMNRRVRARLIEVIADMRHATNNGECDAMRAALINACVALGSLIDDQLVIEWKSES